LQKALDGKKKAKGWDPRNNAKKRYTGIGGMYPENGTVEITQLKRYGEGHAIHWRESALNFHAKMAESGQKPRRFRGRAYGEESDTN